MATPRKHWFRVADSVADEDWSNDVLATLIRVQARMNTRWARNGLGREEAATIVLTAGECMTVTRRSSFRRASELLSRCQEAVNAELLVGRSSVKFTWPKWPAFQGLPSRELPESRPRAAPSLPPPPPPPPPQDKRSRKRSAEPAAPAQPPAQKRPGRKKTSTATEPPEELTPEQREKLLGWAQRKEPWAEPKLDDFIDACLDWHRQQPEEKKRCKSDWIATLRGWVRLDRKYAERDGRKHPSQTWVEDEKRRKMLAEVKRRREERERLYGPPPPDATTDPWGKEIPESQL